MQKHSWLFDSLFKYLVCAILLVVPLYPKFPLVNIPGTFVAVRLEDVLLFGAAIAAVIGIFTNSKLFRNTIAGAIVIYLLVGLFSLISAALVTKTIEPLVGFLHLLRRVEYFIPFFVGLAAIRKAKNLPFYLNVLLVTVFIAFLYGFGQRYFEWPIIITQNEEYSRGIALRWIPGSHINSTFAGHYDLATFLVLVLPFIITSLFVLKGKFTKIILFAAWLCGLWLVVNSASRISLVSYLVSGGIALLLLKKYKGFVALFLVSFLFTLTSPSLQARYKRLFEVSIEKLQNVIIFDYRNILAREALAQDVSSLPQRKDVSPTPPRSPVFEDRSTSIRLNVEWPRAIRAFSKNPILGTGFSSITLATDNDYLRFLGETGLLGLFSFFLIFVRLGVLVLKAFPPAKFFGDLNLAFVTGMIGALPGIFLNAVFIDVFEASKFAIIFWLLLGMFVGLLPNLRKEGA